MTTVDSKLCRSCKEIKSITEFYKDKQNKDGFTSTCKVCRKLVYTQYCVQNKEAIKTYNAQYNIKNKEAKKERDANNYSKKKEAKRAQQAKYRAQHKEAKRMYSIQYRAEHKEKTRIYNHTRRARKRLVSGSHTNNDILMLREIQRHRCAICKCSVKKKYHVDHIYPLSSGGSNGKENLQILCPACNLSKKAKDPIQFMNQNGLLL